MSQQPARAPIATSNRIWTIPNVISFVRLLGVPVFLYLLLGPRHDLAAVIVLTAGGTTDWVDGYVARRIGQVSRLGELLDPFADRLYILATLVGFTLREVVPWWLTAALLLRELVLGIALLVLRRNGHGPPPVHYVGKTGTFVLLGAFPVLLLATALPDASEVLKPLGWGLAWWALGLYWAAAALYLIQATTLLRADRSPPSPSPNGGGTPVAKAALPTGGADARPEVGSSTSANGDSAGESAAGELPHSVDGASASHTASAGDPTSANGDSSARADVAAGAESQAAGDGVSGAAVPNGDVAAGAETRPAGDGLPGGSSLPNRGGTSGGDSKGRAAGGSSGSAEVAG